MPSAEALGAVRAEDAPELLGALKALEAQLWRRLLALHPAERTTSDEPLLTVPEAAKLLAFEESYVRELTRKGELPCVRHGKYVRVTPADVRAWIERHRDREVDPAPSLRYPGRRGRRRQQRPAASEVN